LATLTVQKITNAGIIPTFSAVASDGDLIPNADGKTFIYAKNTGASDVIIKATAITPCDYGEYHSMSETVSATTGEMAIALSKRLNTGGNISLTYEGSVSGLTLAAFNYPGTL
jgi:hypothetical protein